MSFSEITRKIAESLSGIFSSNSARKYQKDAFKPRRLHMDTLEERQLLSVNAVMPQEQILTSLTPHTSPTISSNTFFINGSNPYGGAVYTETTWGNDYMASNNQGDTVIVWAQNDYVYRMTQDGEFYYEGDEKVRLIDRYGNYYDDYNIYAQYLTDQVDRLSIPMELLEDNISGKSGSFKLVYAPYEMQRLSIKTVTDASGSGGRVGDGVIIQFDVGGADTDQDGVPNFAPVIFNEIENSPSKNAQIIQTALRDLGGIYAEVTVTAESTTDFLITFGENVAGVNVPEIETRNVQVTSGIYPGIAMSTVSEPIVLTNTDSWGNETGIIVDPSNPEQTALRIQQAFDNLSGYSAFPRVENFNRGNNALNPDGSAINAGSRPSYTVFYTPEVTVSIVEGNNITAGTTFDITFVCSAGLTLHDLMLVSATDEFGTEYVSYQGQTGAASESGYSVETVKRSSEAFRVNAPEENDPNSIVPLVTNQMNPSVAMDSDGDFVITWQSESGSVGGTTVTDIFARQFSPQGIVDESKITFYSDGYTTKRTYGGEENTAVQSVRPVGDQFQVNTYSNFYSTSPSIGMDADGNYIIAWATTYNHLSDGNAVYAKRYDRYSNALTDDVRITGDYDDFPLNHVQVSMSDAGYSTISWVYSEVGNTGLGLASTVYMSAFAPGSLTAMPGMERAVIVSNSYNPNVSFDADSNLVITYSTGADVYFRMFDLTVDEEGVASYQQVRDEKRAHSLAGFAEGTLWGQTQTNGIGKLDADGDVVFVYQGFGPDAGTGTISIPGSYFASYINEYKNSDLQIFFNPQTQNFSPFIFGTSDVDVAIRNYLAQAIKQGANYDQISRLNAVFESVAGMMRGGANDIFTTTIEKGNWDNNPANVYTPVASSSDANVTSTRDGVNARYYIMIPRYTGYVTGAGTFTTRINGVDVDFVLPTVNGVFIPGDFPAEIRSKVNGITAFNPINGMVEVNYYTPGTYETYYDDTMWAMPEYTYSDAEDIDGYHVYEIIFIDGLHDTSVSFSRVGGHLYRNQYPDNPNFIGDVSYVAQHGGYAGAAQTTPGLSVLPNGSYVVSWFTNVTTTNGAAVDRMINYRYFDEAIDKVGPKVTDVILPNGEYVANNAMVTYSLENLVVTFDKELLANGEDGLHSVLNPKNWAIMKDGIQIDVIESISFGVNKSRDMISDDSELADSILSYGSNKWEVVITFSEPLTTGNYELVATNMISDTTGIKVNNDGSRTYGLGNSLGRNGNNADGENFSRLFSVNAIDGLLTFGDGTGVSYDDTLVSDMAGEHHTRIPTDRDTPSNPTSVASDEQGNFVTVWTAENNGIWAKIYHQEFIETANGRESVITVYREFQVTNNPTATYASVAMDADGDFVVTWMQEDADGRNIYAKAYNANGSTRTDANGNVTTEFRVNSHSNGTHSYPDIAVDATGGFVITWESLNQTSKTSGYDIYYQRYDSACTAIGGTDEIQSIQFAGSPSAGGTFRIEFEGQLTNEIQIGTNSTITAANIKAALLAIGLDVDVAAASSDTVLIQFTATMGARDVSPLTVPTQYVKLIDPKSGQSIAATTLTTGASGESRANDTTEGDQRYAAIAMAQSGEFIITWTSWGQDDDAAYETNIYAKNFSSNATVAARYSQVTLAERIEIMTTQSSHEKLIVASDSPANHETSDDEYTGVVYIHALFSDGTYVGSGSLLTSGMHILTAAHVVYEDALGPIAPENLIVEFVTATGSQFFGVSQNIVHPTYTGNYTVETDLAVLTLTEIAPENADRYDIYRGSDEVGSTYTVVGFGTAGTGETGNILPAGTRRFGENTFEAFGNIFGTEYNANTLVYDFDSGSPQNDAFGYYFGIYDTGLGAAREVGVAGGDSGGPSFLAGKIAGVTSYGGPMYENSVTDILEGVNGSFGEFGVMVRVSAYADWIDAIVTTGTSEYLVNQTVVGDQIWSDVAISMSGEVVFSWTSYNQDNAGDGPGGSSNGLAGVYARRFNLDGTPVEGTIGGVITVDPDTGEITVTGDTIALGDEFLVNDYIVGNQYYSSVAMANNGDFIITWESFQDSYQVPVSYPDTGHGAGGPTTITVTDYGIYAKRYTNLSTLEASRDNTNTAQYGLPDNTRYVPGYGYVGIHGEIGSEFRVNKINYVGDQTGATVTMNANGDAIVVFQGDEGEGTESNVYYRALPLSVDTAPPTVTETVAVVDEPDYDANNSLVYDTDGNIVTTEELLTITDGSVIYGYVKQMIVTFSEEMYSAYIHDPSSVTNTANWQLLKSGVSMYGAIVKVEFGQDKAFELGLVATKTGKWEAVVTFDSNVALVGEQPLTTGSYTLVINDNATDTDENRLDGDYNGTAGGNFTRPFYVMTPTTGDDDDDDDGDDNGGIPITPEDPVYLKTEMGNDQPAVASAADGSFAIVAVHYGLTGTPNEPEHPSYYDYDEYGFVIDANENWVKVGNIVLQRYDALGNKVGTEKIVNNFMAGIQTEPEIAMDSYGNFAVVWTGHGPTSNTAVYCRLYDSYGDAVVDQFQVNSNNTAVCTTPNVAYDDAGNILVSWIEYNSTTNSYAVMFRVYDSKGVLQSVSFNGAAASTTQKVLVSENARSIQHYDIAFDPAGNLVVTWQMHNTGSNTQDIFAQVFKYTANGGGQGTLTSTVSRFIVNQYVSNMQTRPSVATSSVGTFVITWASERQDGSSFGIYARRFDMSGKALSILGTTGDAQINTTTLNSQNYPDVSMAANGNFVITWTSFGQEPDNYDFELGMVVKDNGAFARAFNANGTDLTGGFVPSSPAHEFRLNFTTLHNQQYSVATIHNDGMAFAWVGDVTSQIDVAFDDTGLPTEYVEFETTDVFVRAYTTRTDIGSNFGGNSTLASSYSLTQKTGGGGYAGQGTATYKYENLETLFLDGTDGDDLFEILISASGVFQVKVNGATQAVGVNVKDIQIDGLGGTDKVVITTVAGDNTARVNAGENRVTLAANDGSFTISAMKVEVAELNAGGLNNAIYFVAAGNDVLTAKVGDASLVGGNYAFYANGFETLTASASDKSSRAILFDSVGDDTVTMWLGKAVMKGQDYQHTVTGFGSVSAYSTLGNDVAYLYGSADNEAVFASAAAVSMVSGANKNTASGFAKSYVVGNGGTDSATVAGSYKADRFTGTDSYAEMNFGLGGEVGFYGFSNFNVRGNGGNDVVSLSGVSLKTDKSPEYVVYSNKTQTYQVAGVDNIRVIQEATTGSDASALMATSGTLSTLDVSPAAALPEAVIEVTKVSEVPATQAAATAIDSAVNNAGDDLLQLLALEHVNNSGSQNADNTDDDALDIEYLLKIGAL